MALKDKGKKSILSNLRISYLITKFPFLAFLTGIALIYILNANISQKKIRQINVLKDEVKSLRWEHASLKSEINKDSKRSSIVSSVETLNLKEPNQQIKKILIPKK